MTYNELKRELANLPSTWYPAMLKALVEAAIRKGVFENEMAAACFVHDFNNEFSSQDAAIDEQVKILKASGDRLAQALKANSPGSVANQEKETTMALDPNVQALATQVAQNTSVEASAVQLIEGLAASLATALQNAQSAGVDPTDLAEIQTLQTSLATSAAALAGAVMANTPAAPAPTGGTQASPPAPAAGS